MVVSSIFERQVRKDLEKCINTIKSEIEKIETYDDVKEFLDSMFDVQVLVDMESNDIVGFNISKIVGGGSVYVECDHGFARIEGWWFPVRLEVVFNSKKADLILDYLSNMWEG